MTQETIWRDENGVEYLAVVCNTKLDGLKALTIHQLFVKKIVKHDGGAIYIFKK